MKKALSILFALSFLISTPTLANSYTSAKKKYKKALRTKNVDQIIEALQELAKTNSLKAVKYILTEALRLDYYGLDDAAVVKIYDAALEALREISDKKAIQYSIKKCASHRSWQVRVMLIDVVKRYNSKAAAKAIAKNIKHKHQPVALAAIQAAKEMRSKECIPNLIYVLKKQKKRKNLTWIETKKALVHITGKDFDTAEEYSKWWKMAGSHFNPNRVSYGNTIIRLGKKKPPKLFGTEIFSKRIIFVLDVSGSMTAVDPPSNEGGRPGTISPSGGGNNPATGGGQNNESRRRITRAKNELIKVVKMLDRDVKFNIIVFSSNVRSWKAPEKLFWASPGNKASAIKWVQGLSANGFTWTDEALKEAFKNQEVNTIYLLSDGSPTKDGQNMMDTNKILEMVKKLNRFRKIRIFTLGFIGANRPFMQSLAEQNNGKYRDIK
ncbi:MAG: VWA domain-containing protein [Planctomycetota bacterium]|nr:MAG: VWA domain-containing protein [Planctomycetota bacterium]